MEITGAAHLVPVPYYTAQTLKSEHIRSFTVTYKFHVHCTV